MTKSEALIFIEKMGRLGDDWTEEQVLGSSYANMSLSEALEDRMVCMSIGGKIAATVIDYLAEKEEG